MTTATLAPVIVRLRRFIHATAVIRQGTGHMLKLDSRVMDAEAAKHLIQTSQNPVALRRRHILDQYM